LDYGCGNKGDILVTGGSVAFEILDGRCLRRFSEDFAQTAARQRAGQQVMSPVTFLVCGIYDHAVFIDQKNILIIKGGFEFQEKFFDSIFKKSDFGFVQRIVRDR